MSVGCQARRVVLLALEDDRPDVTVEEADNDWLGLVGRARKDMRSLQELLDCGDLANNFVSQCTLENREEGRPVDGVHHLVVVVLVLLGHLDVEYPRTPGTVALIHVVDQRFEARDLLVAVHQLLLEALVLVGQPLDEHLEAVHARVVGLDGRGQCLELLGHVGHRILDAGFGSHFTNLINRQAI